MVDPSPVAGDPGEAYAAALQLGRVLSHGQRCVTLVSEARLSLAHNSSQSTDRLDSGLSSQVLDAMRRALAGAENARTAFHTYAEQTEEIHARARRIGQDIEAQLDVIRVCAARIQTFEASLGRRLSSDWQIGVPLLMPESLLTDESASVGLGSHSIHGYGDELAYEWREAAGAWLAAIEQIERWQVTWRGLYHDRVDSERRLVSTLSAISLGEGLGVGLGIGAFSVAAVAPGFAGATGARTTPAVSLQRRTAPSGDPANRRSHPLLTPLFRKFAGSVALTGQQMSAAEVEGWWAQLSDRDKRTLTAEVPLVIGNLNGVPLDARISANAVSAGHFAEAAGIGSEEARYWERVSTGSVKLVVSDPENSRIIEMIGEIGPKTERVVTFLPGTTSQMKHFYSGEAQQVSRYLVNRSKGSTVAFVYKDGSWVSWLGPGSNTNYERLKELGEQVAAFQEQLVVSEPTLHDLPQAAVAHSAGMSVVSGAEIAGAQFDSVLSLGGAFTLSGWTPNPETNYHHFQYENDAINLIDGGRLHTPNELTGVFRPHRYPSEGRARMHSHSRIADGVQTNGKALKDMLDTLEGK